MKTFSQDVHYRVLDNGCHQWIRATSHDGYAHAVIDGEHVYVHRHVWEDAHGVMEPGMTVDHLCFNPSCINLAHLRELDFMTNSRLQRSSLKTECNNGHPYSESNTYRRPDGRRGCRRCRVAATARLRARKRAAA